MNSVKFTLLAMISFLLCETNTFAQNTRIAGVVQDAITMKPLSDVNVILEGTLIGAATNENGRFEIFNVPVGTYSVKYSRLGYLTVVKPEIIVTVGAFTQSDALLSPTDVQAEEVEFSISRFAIRLNSTSATTLEREEIRRFPGGFEDIVRTVATLPGVAVVNQGGRNDLLVRGGGPSENLYVVNGLEVPNINHFGVQGSGSGSLSFINLDFVNNVSFSTGGFGAEYGDRMSSVLSIDLRNGREDRLGGRATVSASQYGLDLEGPIFTDGTFIFSARKSYLDLIFKAAGLPFVPVYTDFNLTTSWRKPNGDRFTIIGLAALDKVDRDVSSHENRVRNAGIMDNTQDQFIAGGAWRKIVDKGYLDLVTGVSAVEYNFGQADTNLIEYFRSRSSENEFNLKATRVHIDFLGGTFKAGVAGKFAKIENSTSFADTIYDRSGNRFPVAESGLPQTLEVSDNFEKGAVFFEHQWNVLPQTIATVGIRSDYYGFINEKFYPSYRTRLVHRLNDAWSVKTSYGRYYQSPAYVWIVNPDNKNLKALNSSMSIVGAEYLFREDILFDVEAYYKQIEDLPAGNTPDSDYFILTNAGVGYGGREDDFNSFGYRSLSSTGKGKAYGLELQMIKSYSPDGIYGQAGLSLSRSIYTAPNGKSYPGQYEQQVIFSVSAGYKPNIRWEYSGKFRFWTGSPYTPVYRPSENNGRIVNLPEEYLSKRLSSGHHLDLRIDRRFSFNRWGMIVYADIQNVYNFKIHYPPSYNFWDDSVEDRSGIALLPSLGIRVEF